MDHCWAHAGHKFFVLTAAKQLLVFDRSGLLCRGRLEVACSCMAALADDTIVVSAHSTSLTGIHVCADCCKASVRASNLSAPCLPACHWLYGCFCCLQVGSDQGTLYAYSLKAKDSGICKRLTKVHAAVATMQHQPACSQVAEPYAEPGGHPWIIYLHRCLYESTQFQALTADTFMATHVHLCPNSCPCCAYS